MKYERYSLKLSVVTIAYESASECRMVIQELKSQTSRTEMEVILIAPNQDGIEDKDFDGFGEWQWVILPEVPTFGNVMETAVRVARAPFITYAEEHSYFHRTWAERLIAAHEKGYDAVGFAIENANPKTLVSWAHLYAQFGSVVAPVESGESDFLAGHHVSYCKELLLGYGNHLRDVLEDESVLFLDFNRKGKTMFIQGDAVSGHINVSSLKSYMYLEFIGQRSFGSSRARIANWSWWKRVLYIGAAPLIPFLRLRRILADIRRTNRQDKLLPQIFLPLIPALIAGTFGEILGYLFGGGDTATQKAPFEFQRERFLSKEDG